MGKNFGDSVYHRPLQGDDAIDDDVEGHAMKGLSASRAPAASRQPSASDDDDVEGHGTKLS